MSALKQRMSLRRKAISGARKDEEVSKQVRTYVEYECKSEVRVSKQVSRQASERRVNRTSKAMAIDSLVMCVRAYY